jgi:hypothetical protein
MTTLRIVDDGMDIHIEVKDEIDEEIVRLALEMAKRRAPIILQPIRGSKKHHGHYLCE